MIQIMVRPAPWSCIHEIASLHAGAQACLLRVVQCSLLLSNMICSFVFENYGAGTPLSAAPCGRMVVPSNSHNVPVTGSLRQVGGTAVRLSPLGFGAAPIGNLYTEVCDDEAIAAVQAAYATGIRHFDTAPYYGYGLSESRLGQALQAFARTSYTLSTKVGRRLFDDPTATAGREGFAVAGRRAEFDYSRDGIQRSLESSLKRLRTDYIDLLLLHDIGRLTHGEQHSTVLRQVLDEALPLMTELKQAGVIGAIGIGVNEQEVAVELLPRFPLDCVMLAGRYTLLEQQASHRIMQQALQTGTSILVAGPYSSGLLGDARQPGSTYNYHPVDAATLLHAQRIYAACHAQNVDVGAAALQFPLAHPAVVSVVAGMRTPEEVDSAAQRLHSRVPATLWQQLQAQCLLENGVPLP